MTSPGHATHRASAHHHVAPSSAAHRSTAHRSVTLRPASPRYFALRLTRGGPLLPAKLQWIDHEPFEPGNRLDRWPPVYPFVDVGGEVVPPEVLTDRFHWPRGHWKWAQPITEAEYRYRLDYMRWAETHQKDDPTLAPRRRLDPRQGTLPSFERENAHVRR